MKNKKRWREINRVYEREQAKRYGKRSYNRAGKAGSKNLKRERIRNKRLCKQYPWLIPRNSWTGEICWIKRQYDHTELDDMADGWRKAFGDVWCEEIHKALVECNFVDGFRIDQMKEKFGELRCYVNNYAPPIDHIINAFEVISQHVCIKCGKLDSPAIDDYGWYLPLCKKCYEQTAGYFSKLNRVSYEDRLVEAKIEEADMKIPEIYTIRRWSKDKDDAEDIVYDISDLVAKIRYKNRKRDKHG